MAMKSKRLESSEGIPRGFYRMKNTIDMKGLKSVSPKIKSSKEMPKMKMEKKMEKKMKNLKPSYHYPQYA